MLRSLVGSEMCIRDRVMPLSAHLLEISYDAPPFEDSSTIAGSVKNVSGTPMRLDVRALAFAFGQNGIFIGYGSTTIKGPIPIDQPKRFRLKVDTNHRNVERFYLQFEGSNTVLSYEVNGGPRPESWPSTPSHPAQSRTQSMPSHPAQPRTQSIRTHPNTCLLYTSPSPRDS